MASANSVLSSNCKNKNQAHSNSNGFTTRTGGNSGFKSKSNISNTSEKFHEQPSASRTPNLRNTKSTGRHLFQLSAHGYDHNTKESRQRQKQLAGESERPHATGELAKEKVSEKIYTVRRTRNSVSGYSNCSSSSININSIPKTHFSFSSYKLPDIEIEADGNSVFTNTNRDPKPFRTVIIDVECFTNCNRGAGATQTSIGRIETVASKFLGATTTITGKPSSDNDNGDRGTSTSPIKPGHADSLFFNSHPVGINATRVRPVGFFSCAGDYNCSSNGAKYLISNRNTFKRSTKEDVINLALALKQNKNSKLTFKQNAEKLANAKQFIQNLHEVKAKKTLEDYKLKTITHCERKSTCTSKTKVENIGICGGTKGNNGIDGDGIKNDELNERKVSLDENNSVQHGDKNEVKDCDILQGLAFKEEGKTSPKDKVSESPEILERKQKEVDNSNCGSKRSLRADNTWTKSDIHILGNETTCNASNQNLPSILGKWRKASGLSVRGRDELKLETLSKSKFTQPLNLEFISNSENSHKINIAMKSKVTDLVKVKVDTELEKAPAPAREELVPDSPKSQTSAVISDTEAEAYDSDCLVIAENESSNGCANTNTNECVTSTTAECPAKSPLVYNEENKAEMDTISSKSSTESINVNSKLHNLPIHELKRKLSFCSVCQKQYGSKNKTIK